jgi:dipeptidyl aminopeptidase/acylaminoacyl peptidase
MVSLAAVDQPGGWVYYIASPDNATQRGHDTTIDGWVIRPSKFDASKKYPIIISVYGNRQRRQ